MSLVRSEIRDAMVSALKNAQTMAEGDVYAVRDWPETEPELPAIIVSMPAETKTSWGPNGPKFNTTATIVVLGRVQGTSSIDAEAKAEQFCDEIQNAVLTDLNVLALIQSISTVDTSVIVTDAGENQIGEVSIAFGMDFPEVFQPGIPQPLTSIKITATAPGRADLLAVATLPQT